MWVTQNHGLQPEKLKWSNFRSCGGTPLRLGNFHTTIYLSIDLPTYLPIIYLPSYPSSCLSICLSIYLPVYLSIELSFFLSIICTFFIVHYMYIPGWLYHWPTWAFAHEICWEVWPAAWRATARCMSLPLRPLREWRTRRGKGSFLDVHRIYACIVTWWQDVMCSSQLSVYLCIFPSIYLYIYPPTDLSIYPSIHPSFCLCIYPSICLSIYLSIFLSI
jgi:hypothetical protein